MHNDFTMFSRKIRNTKTVIYYYAYDVEGVRRGPWSTGEETKTAARNVLNRMSKEGRLIPGKCGTPLFADFAQGFWEWDTCEYLKDRRKRTKLTQSYADKNKMVLLGQLIPYFGKKRLDWITADDIEGWLDYMQAKGYRNTTINGYYGTLQTMIKWAVKKRKITTDPTLNIERLVNDQAEMKIVSREEFHALFGNDWREIWGNDRIKCAANKLAALTGMRISEVLGLRGEYVFQDHVFVCAQFDEYGYRDTKMKQKHNIPITAELAADLKELTAVNGEGYVFSLDGGISPVTRKHIYNGLRGALRKIGMSDAEIKDRGLTLHAWRHFCNTELQKAGLNLRQVQAVTGHRSVRMTEHYTHFDPEEFGQVPQAQAALLRGTGEAETEQQGNESGTRRERPSAWGRVIPIREIKRLYLPYIE